MNIKCGIYQGDALSLLLFCIDLNPLSQIITKSGYGYIQTSCKYLGIPQSHRNHDEESRKTATLKYHQRVRQVLKIQLNGKKKIKAINTFAQPVIRYPASIVSWTKEEMEAADVKTFKLLTMQGGFHPKYNVQRLYTSRKEGGWGLVSVQVTILDETQNIQEYIHKKAPKDKLLGECLRQQQRGTDDQPEEMPLHSKALHGMYHRQIVEVADIRKSYQWLEKAGLTDSTEALILAAQEQALGTRSIEAGVYHTRQDPRCRLCKDASETVQHIVAGCKMQAGTANTERHNQAAGIVYRNICSEYKLDPPKSR